MRLFVLPASVALLLAGCAAGGPAPTGAADPAVQRGHALAERRCSGCHVIGLDDHEGASGPRFRDIRRRFNALSLQKRFGEITQHGSGEMPQLQVSRSDAEDLVAYIESLDAR